MGGDTTELGAVDVAAMTVLLQEEVVADVDVAEVAWLCIAVGAGKKAGGGTVIVVSIANGTAADIAVVGP
jgi:hypothetical protein